MFRPAYLWNWYMFDWGFVWGQLYFKGTEFYVFQLICEYFFYESSTIVVTLFKKELHDEAYMTYIFCIKSWKVWCSLNLIGKAMLVAFGYQIQCSIVNSEVYILQDYLSILFWYIFPNVFLDKGKIESLTQVSEVKLLDIFTYKMVWSFCFLQNLFVSL